MSRSGNVESANIWFSRTAIFEQWSNRIDHLSRNDFQRRDLVAFKFEKESKVNRTAGKVSNQMAGDDRLPLLLFARNWLACVFILCRGIRLPFSDCGPAFVGVPLVLHDGIVSETLRDGLAVTPVCGEVGGDLFWQVERFRCLFHIHVLSCWCIFFLPS